MGRPMIPSPMNPTVCVIIPPRGPGMIERTSPSGGLTWIARRVKPEVRERPNHAPSSRARLAREDGGVESTHGEGHRPKTARRRYLRGENGGLSGPRQRHN